MKIKANWTLNMFDPLDYGHQCLLLFSVGTEVLTGLSVVYFYWLELYGWNSLILNVCHNVLTIICQKRD